MSTPTTSVFTNMLRREKEYWAGKLSGELAAVTFPADFMRREPASNERDAVRFNIDKGTEDRLRQMSGNNETLAFAILVAALKICLHKYNGAEDILVGTAIHEKYAETAALNTLLILRDRVSGVMTAKELLLDVKRTLSEAYSNQKYPFGKILEMLGHATAESHLPFFDVMIILENINNKEHIAGVANQMTFAFRINEADMDAALEYDSGLFKRETIDACIEHYKIVLEAMVKSPETRISDLPILTEDERRKILFEWNDVFTRPAVEATIHERFEAQVRATPDTVALIIEDEQLSYDQLNGRANQLAHYLRAEGSGPESLVAICLEPSVEMIVAILGVLKSGAAYVPLDPTYPAARLAFIIEDARPLLVIGRQALSDRLPESCTRIVSLDGDRERIDACGNDNLEILNEPGNLAYIIYTSGSTGRPKGVMVSHAEVIRLFDATDEWFSFGAGDVWTLFHSYAFDFSVWEIWGALLKGGKLVLVPHLVSRAPDQFHELVSREQVSVMNQTPSALQQFIRSDENACAERSNLRLIILGGEALDLGSLKGWFERHPDENPRVINMYGITETTVHVTYRPILKQDLEGPKRSLIGRPIPDLRVYLLGADQQLAPTGAAAEIYVGGRGLSRGYLNRPELTAERFVPDIFSGKAGERLYRAGDLARYIAARDMEYLGRADEQVKVRGYRIEPGEIRAAITRHEGVEDAVVMVRDDNHSGRRLVAYVVTRREASLSEIEKSLKQQLPEYMIPSAFIAVESFPLTTNGKIDRNALPAPGTRDMKSGAAYKAPRDILELRLAMIWEEVLRVRPVGIRDNFFDLGGHSVLSVLLMERIRGSLGMDLPVAMLFQGMTIEDLAAQVRRQNGSPVGSTSLVEIQSGDSISPFFCVHPAGGNVLCYLELARELGPDQSFYGFQSRGIANAEPLHLRIEDMAAHYLELLREAQPDGPYLLGGWSIGGLIAFEMARQLKEQGKHISLLALFDTVAPTRYRRAKEPDHLALLEAFAQDIGLTSEHLELPEGELSQPDSERQLDRILEQAQAAGVLPLDFDFRTARTLFKVFVTNVNAASVYSPAISSGRVTLFRAAERMEPGSADPAEGWDEVLSDEADVRVVPGGHFTMLRQPNVRALAEQLKSCIKKAVE